MMKRFIIICFLPFQFVSGQNSDTITLWSCYEEALRNYPLSRGKELLHSVNEQKIKNIRAGYLPQLNLIGQATYQSDVPHIDIPFPEISITVPPKDQYKLTLDINQVIYNGGLTYSMEKLEKANLYTEVQKVEVELYQIKERINKVYFSILLLQKNEEILKVMMNEINKRIKVMESGVRYGIFMQSDMDILTAELLKTEQQLIEIKMGKSASFKILEELTNKDLPDSSLLKIPFIQATLVKETNRPEHILFEMQINKISANIDLVSKKRLPRMYCFGTFGYGRPGLNMLSDKFDSFYMIGTLFSWNIWDWNQNKRERQILSIQKDVIQIQKETFDKNLKILIENEMAAIQKLEKMIKKDSEIIQLRKRITKTSVSQLENGIITPNNYLANLNSEIQSEINMESHKIQLIQSRINYLTILGKNEKNNKTL